jgi:hypothetical protein
LPGAFGEDGKWHDTVNIYDTIARDSVLEAYLAHEANKENLIGNTMFNKLAENREDVKYKTFSGELAEKVSAELDKVGVAWSGKIDPENEKTSFAFNVKDEMKVNKAVNNAKAPSKEKTNGLKARLEQKKEQAAKLNGSRPAPDKGSKNKAEEL